MEETTKAKTAQTDCTYTFRGFQKAAKDFIKKSFLF
jgi:hypothetical protein